jgi:hypothetical protein
LNSEALGCTLLAGRKLKRKFWLEAKGPTVKKALLIPWLIAILVARVASAQAPAAWQDDLVNHLPGVWKLEGAVMGRQAHHELRAEWVLNHQFLRMHEKTAASAPSGEHPYEAIWYIGYDAPSERYVVHLLDVFGARYSETLGYGAREGNSLRLVFEYPDGPFHTTYRWAPQQDTWQWLLEQRDKNGKWSTFADFKLTRATKE